LGIDLRKMFNTSQAQAFVAAPHRASFFDVLQQIQDTLAKVDLTIYDVIEMIMDAGITAEDIMEVYNYITSTDAPAASDTVMLGEHVEVPVYLLRQYEQTLAEWLLLGGVDVQYDQWGW
jgi:hypothetical protein